MSPARVAAAGVILFATLALLLRAQEESKPKPKDSVYAELASVPQKYRAKPNPLARDPEAPRAGAVLFEEHCEECHGKEGLGGKKAPTLRAPEVQNAGPGSLFYILSNGVVRKGMPVWSKLPEPQRWQLVSYIKSLGATVTESAPEKKP
jgi:mono/diheme cytochrome c family protein